MQTKKKGKRKYYGVNLKPLLLIVAFIAVLLTASIAYRASVSDRNLFSINLLALLAGLLFESFRISDNWKTVAGIFILTYLFSLLTFMPGKNEDIYNFDDHIEFWPYAFIFIYSIFFGSTHFDRVLLKITEGITLVFSISFIYWIIDYGFMNSHSWVTITLMIIGILFSLYSIINSLTNIKLSETNRLILSIWTTIIMFTFAIDNIIYVFSYSDIESSEYLTEGMYFGIQYFLLGISSVYIMRNFMLLVRFLPPKNGNYLEELKENKEDHIKRYSEKQVNIMDSLICIIFTISIYWLNYSLQILPRNTAIWLVILVFPFIIYLINLFTGQKKSITEFSNVENSRIKRKM